MRKLGLALILTATLAGAAWAKPTLSSKEFNGLKKELQRAAAMGQDSVVAEKLAELARDDSQRACELIATVAARLPGVYDAAKRAIAQMSSAEVLEHLVGEVTKAGGRPEEKIVYIDALAEKGADAAGDALGQAALVNWKRLPQVARAAVESAKRLRAVRAVDGMITLLGELEGKEGDNLLVTLVKEALLNITGEQFDAAADWRNYWEPRKEGFRPVTGENRRLAEGGTSERKKPTFFGSVIKSNRLVFVIDVSGSMTAVDPPSETSGQPPRVPTGGGATPPPVPGADSRIRIERAKAQLIMAIDALPPDARFTILAYSGGAAMPNAGGANQNPDEPLPPKYGGFDWLKIWRDQPRLNPANAQSKEEAKAWVSKLEANGSTFTLNALLHAFKVVEADLIVLLSDGFPTEFDPVSGAELSAEQVLEKVTAKNRFRRVRIDTFGFDPAAEQAGRGRRGGGSVPAGFGGGASGLGKFMQDLAEQNGGDYTPIN